MCEPKYLVDSMKFLGWEYTFSQVQCLLYGGTTKILDSQVHSCKHLAEELRRERKYQGKWTKNMSIDTAADIQILHEDLYPVLEKEHRGIRWRDRLPEIIQMVENASMGSVPKTDELKPFFQDMLYHCALKKYETDSKRTFL